MKIPPKSKAAKIMKPMTYSATKERLRCARAVYDVGKFCYEKYPFAARFDFTDEPRRASKTAGRGRR